MHRTNFYFEHQDIIILAYKKTIKIAQSTFNIWISIVFMIFFVNYVDSLPRVTYLFFFFGGGVWNRETMFSQLLKGSSRIQVSAWYFQAGGYVLDGFAPPQFSTNQIQNKNDMVDWSLKFSCVCA